mmetsp:Transcript_16906/g.25576  ORF Transcript_16906/g.25576 Transcript_16906/m.25576 type:complete len:232 (-) Transcript_16906:10-705(-)
MMDPNTYQQSATFNDTIYETTTNPKKKLRVRFDDSLVVDGVSYYTSEESKICWFTNADFLQFASEAKKEAECFQAKQTKKNNPKSFSNIMSYVLKCSANGQVPPTNHFQYFLFWHRICPELRGIERQCTPLAASFMNNYVEDASLSLMELQMKLKVERVPLAQQCELIQKQYASKTHLTRLFARIQGIADASEAAKERKRSLNPIEKGQTQSVPFKKRKADCSNPRISMAA